MARYRKVDTRIWNDQKFNTLSTEGKLLFFFLLSHPHMTAIGGMRSSLLGLASELNWTEEQFRSALQECFLKGMIKYDEKSSFIWLPNFLKYNQPESPNVIKSWEKALDYLPECALKCELIETVKIFSENLSKTFYDALPDVFLTSERVTQIEGIEKNGIHQETIECDPKDCLANESISKFKKDSLGTNTIQAVFDLWKTTLNHPEAKLDKKRKIIINNALKIGYTLEQLCEAIKGCSQTPHNMGCNDRGQRYDGLGIIFKDADNIDRFIRNFHSPPVSSFHNSKNNSLSKTRLAHDTFENKPYSETPTKDIVWLRNAPDEVVL